MNIIDLLTRCPKEHSLHIHYTFSGPRAASNEQRKCQNNTPSLAARFTSTSVQQQPLAVLKLFHGQESTHQHQRREPLQSPRNRRELVPTALWKTPRWRDQKRKVLSRGFGAVSARVRHHHAGTTQQAIREWPALAVQRSLGPIFWGTCASQRSPQERSRNTEFTDTNKQLLNAVSHR